jgi:hypothetical protein
MMTETEKIKILLERTPKLFVLNADYESAADFLVKNGVTVQPRKDEKVRCKDCIHFKPATLRKRFDGYCKLDFMAQKGNNFCGRAERKE